MNFSFNSSNILLVDELLEQFYIKNIFEEIKRNISNLSYNFSNYDLAYMVKVKDENIYNDLKVTKNRQKFNINGKDFFSDMTDKVLEYKLDSTTKISLYDLYNNHLKKLYSIKDLYGIIGVDEELNEVINFTHPFRAISNLKRTSYFYLNKLFIYKKQPKYFIKTEEKDKIQISLYLNLFCSMYKRGLNLKMRKKENYTTYIGLSNNGNNIEVFNKINNNSVFNNSFLYYSDILLLNSFMPYYAIFNLKVNPKASSYLIGTPLQYVPCLSPNIHPNTNVCTGSLPNCSEEGIKSLKYSNLGSPFITNIIDGSLLDFYTTYCITKSKEIYEKGLTYESD